MTPLKQQISLIPFSIEHWYSPYKRRRFVDLETVNENRLDWTPIQARGFGHGGWKQKLDEHHPTKTKKWLGHVLRRESLLRTVLEDRMEGTRTRGRQWYDDRLDEEQRRGIWSYKEFMVDKTGVVGGLDLPEKAEHIRKRSQKSTR